MPRPQTRSRTVKAPRASPLSVRGVGGAEWESSLALPLLLHPRARRLPAPPPAPAACPPSQPAPSRPPAAARSRLPRRRRRPDERPPAVNVQLQPRRARPARRAVLVQPLRSREAARRTRASAHARRPYNHSPLNQKISSCHRPNWRSTPPLPRPDPPRTGRYALYAGMNRATKSATCSSVSPGFPAARICTSACRRHLNTHSGSPTFTTTHASTWRGVLGVGGG